MQEAKFTEFKSPSIKYLIDKLRDPNVQNIEYRNLTHRLVTVMIEEFLACEEQNLVDTKLHTGVNYPIPHSVLKGSDYGIVSIMRSADSMLEPIMRLIEGCSICKVLIQRNENIESKAPKFYYIKHSGESFLKSKKILVIDPMLATGGSACEALNKLKGEGIDMTKVVFLNIISCPEGIQRVNKEFPEVTVWTGSVDKEMNESKYILPGLGDFGDRYFF